MLTGREGWTIVWTMYLTEAAMTSHTEIIDTSTVLPTLLGVPKNRKLPLQPTYIQNMCGWWCWWCVWMCAHAQWLACRTSNAM
jgi:hypothetical protein